MSDSPSPPHILIIDDELSMREFLSLLLQRDGYQMHAAANGREALSMLETMEFDLLLCDIQLGDITGLDILRAAKKANPNTVVIMISAYASAETAVEAMNLGAYDYLPKPFDNNELKQAVAKALESRTLDQEKKQIDEQLRQNLHFGLIVGNHPKMLHIYDMISQISQTRTNVLISGESGTGKEMIARAIHQESPRKTAPFVAINCGGIPETLLESELFGYRKGAFTGASSDKKGMFEQAEGGTLFLDEIGEVEIQTQVKLLRAVQEKRIRSVGADADTDVDVRIISATNRNLEEEVIEGRFREDLFYRLNVIEIKLPPLRERKSDLRDLAQHFLDKYAREAGKEITKISSYAIDLLTKYDFPGNIRELENLMERSVALTSTNIILPDSLAMSIHKRRGKNGIAKDRDAELDAVADGVSLDHVLSEMEKKYIVKALEITRGNKQNAAKLLGINLRSLRYRVSKLNIVA
ncbi:MAG: Fis family transcriptional regulator [Desulfobacterales bacterium]|nr:MAG: Fis family transcriptional regulator [Desulfobacterales bacterium]